MDSLLASYGSDEDDEEENAPSQLRSQQQASPFHPVSSLHSVARPSEPAAEPSVKRPRFSSLPPPKQPSLPVKMLANSMANEFRGSNGHKLSVGGIGRIRHEANGEGVDALGLEPENSSLRTEEKDDDGPKPTRVSSLLGTLPPPKSRRTVEFKPPVNMSLLRSRYEDEDRVSLRKEPLAEQRQVTSKGEEKTSSLAAILPPPKNSLGVGAALGAGAGGRRHAMETLPEGVNGHSIADEEEVYNSQTQDIPHVVNHGSREAGATSFSAYSNYAGHQLAGHRTEDLHHQHIPYSGPVWNSSNLAAEVQSSGPWLSPDQTYTNQAGFEANTSATKASNSVTYSSTNQIHTYELPNEANFPPAVGRFEMPPEDPLEQVLKRERRRGKEDALPVVLEVKQDDLTAQKIREDQMRVTGIAFGPSYKPVSANKDKPSKLQRRKHQISSLYFDMKQKEMELLERRAKGHLTKAETQAKYGW